MCSLYTVCSVNACRQLELNLIKDPVKHQHLTGSASGPAQPKQVTTKQAGKEVTDISLAVNPGAVKRGR